jgi:hypothetical protein
VTPLVEGARLGWRNSSSKGTVLAVMRSADLYGSSCMDVALLPPDALSWEDSFLPTGAYSYRIEVRNAATGEVATSATVPVVTRPRTVPGLEFEPPALIAMPPAYAGVHTPAGAWILAQKTQPDLTLQIPNGSTWSAHALPGSTSFAEPCVALDERGFPHSVYLTQVSTDPILFAILHTWFDGSAWHVEEVARRGPGTSWGQPIVKFALGKGGAAHLVWASGRPLEPIEHAARSTDGSWTTETIAADTRPPIGNTEFRLALDLNGLPLVLLSANGGLELWHWGQPGAWSWETLPLALSGVENFSGLNLTVSTKGDLEVVFNRTPLFPPGPPQVQHLQKAGAAWTAPRTLASLVGLTTYVHAPTVALSPDGQRLAAAIASADGELLIMRDKGVWSTVVLGSSPSNPPLLAFDAQGKVTALEPDFGFTSDALATWTSFVETP